MNLFDALCTQGELSARYLASAELRELCEVHANAQIENTREYRIACAFLSTLPDSEDASDPRTRLSARILANVARSAGERAREAHYNNGLHSHWDRVVAGDYVARALLLATFEQRVNELMAQNSSWCAFSWEPVHDELARMRDELERRGASRREVREFACFAYGVERTYNGLITLTGCAVFDIDDSTQEREYLALHRDDAAVARAERRRARREARYARENEEYERERALAPNYGERVAQSFADRT